MPVIYLSPSAQEGEYYSGGTEKQWMNRLADAMEPYLNSSGIQFARRPPDMTAASAIRQANEGNYDLYLALHTNQAPPDLAGQLRGIQAAHYPGSVPGKRAADLFVNNLRVAYPLPSQVRVISTDNISELRLVRAPSVFLELGYHDNPDDAAWITGNIDVIAPNLVQSLARYLGIPFLMPMTPRRAVVDVTSGYLNIRSKPSTNSSVIAHAYDGASLTVLNQYYGWYLVRFGDVVGYASSDYVTLI